MGPLRLWPVRMLVGWWAVMWLAENTDNADVSNVSRYFLREIGRPTLAIVGAELCSSNAIEWKLGRISGKKTTQQWASQGINTHARTHTRTRTLAYIRHEQEIYWNQNKQRPDAHHNWEYIACLNTWQTLCVDFSLFLCPFPCLAFLAYQYRYIEHHQTRPVPVEYRPHRSRFSCAHYVRTCVSAPRIEGRTTGQNCPLLKTPNNNLLNFILSSSTSCFHFVQCVAFVILLGCWRWLLCALLHASRCFITANEFSVLSSRFIRGKFAVWLHFIELDFTCLCFSEKIDIRNLALLFSCYP